MRVVQTQAKVSGGSGVERDPDYDWIAPIPTPADPPRGKQCGECGMKFDYGTSYGYSCPNTRCPCGWGPIR